MAGSINKCIIIGNLGADPEIRSFQSGGRVCNLRVATSEQWKDPDGNKQERSEWHSVALFSDGLINVAENYLRKGSKVYIEGQLQTRKWQDQSGNDRYTTEIVLRGFSGTLVMLDGRGDDRGERRRGYDEPNGSQGHAQAGHTYDDLDSDIPFARNDGIW